MKIFMLWFLILSLINSSAQDRTSKQTNNEYLGQKPPGIIPEVFLPGIVSTKEFFEFSNTISPDGKEFYFARRIDNRDIQMVVRKENNILTQPEEAYFLKTIGGFEPHISPDGSKTYLTRFALPPSGLTDSTNLIPQDMEAQMVNIWVMEKSNSGWGEPKFCVNGMYVTTSNSGTIYTTDIRSTSEGVCRYPLIDGKYSEREYLPGGVNFPAPGAHPCIAPDESFIIFDSKRKDNAKDADLYVCFKQNDGNWSEAFSLGDSINTKWNEICPALSPNGKYLFYTSRTDIYWVSTKIIENLKPKQ